MRVLSRDEFMKLPDGTAFQKGKPWLWRGLCFKQQTLSNDWYYCDDDLFLVYDTEDLLMIRAWIEQAIDANKKATDASADGSD